MPTPAGGRCCRFARAQVVLLRSDCIRHQQQIEAALADKGAALTAARAARTRLKRREREVTLTPNP